MKKVMIENLSYNQINGVNVMLPDEESVYKEDFFEWRPSLLTTCFQSNEITGGVLKAWHHTPIFDEIETHIDKEVFYFVSGTAIMLFVDVIDNKPNMDSAQMVRIYPGTQIAIDEGKGHFVAVAECNEPIYAIVVAPKMDAPRIKLEEAISGI